MLIPDRYIFPEFEMKYMRDNVSHFPANFLSSSTDLDFLRETPSFCNIQMEKFIGLKSTPPSGRLVC
jgi:hypothetical protein